jgi:FeS assembly SUF system protein
MSKTVGLRRTFADVLRWVRDQVDPEDGAPAPSGAAVTAPTAPAPEVALASEVLSAPDAVSAREVALAEVDAPVEPSPELEVDVSVLSETTHAETSSEPGQAAEGGDARTPEQLYDLVVEMLHTVFDPEIPVDIYELGLVYGVDVLPDRRVQVRMTLTSPSCPSAQQIPEEVQAKVESVDGVVSADVEIVWEPPWTPMMMSEEARLELNV